MGMLLLNGSSDLNPRELFANNEQGLWLDPSDMTAGKAGWRRNLLGYSEQLDNSYWTKLNCTITASEASSPIGNVADTITVSNAGGTGANWVRKPSQTVVIGSPITFSVYAKKTNNDWFFLRLEDTAVVTAKHVYFNLATGTKGSNDSGVTGSVVDAGNGWYRCSITFSSAATATVGYNFGPCDGDGVVTATQNGTISVLATGVQAEQSSTPTEYQPITDFSTEFKAAFPTHTLYQDSNGVTPCTAAGDPVGLILDQSRGGLGALGAELVANGGFDSWSGDNPTGWTIEGTENATNYVTESSGRARVVSDGSAMGISQTILTVGKWYAWSADVISVTGTCKFVFGTAETLFTTPGKKSGIVNANGTKFQVRREFACDAVVDNISIREIPGNHAYQTTSASRPTLARIPSSGRRNLLTRTEEFDNAAWTKLQCSISANNSTAPDGTSTADLIVEDSTTNGRYVQQAVTTTVQSYTFSVYLKNPSVNGRRYALLYHNESVKGWAFDLQNGVVGAGGTTAVGAPAAYGIESVGNGWYRCYITITGTAASNQFRVYPINNNGSGNASYTGDGVSGILVWGAQLETGSTATNYQKVVATTDVTESGVSDLWHLVFDGSDDSLTTNSVDMTGTAQMTVIAGVRRNGTGTGMILEHTADLNSNNGAFYIYTDFIERTLFASRGTTPQSKHSGTITTPYTAVKTLTTDISAPSITGRVNGAVVATDANTQGTGNYANAALYIGRRGGSSLPFNGHLYQLIIRGKTTPTGKLLEAERFVARRTGVTGI